MLTCCITYFYQMPSARENCSSKSGSRHGTTESAGWKRHTTGGGRGGRSRTARAQSSDYSRPYPPRQGVGRPQPRSKDPRPTPDEKPRALPQSRRPAGHMSLPIARRGQARAVGPTCNFKVTWSPRWRLHESTSPQRRRCGRMKVNTAAASFPELCAQEDWRRRRRFAHFGLTNSASKTGRGRRAAEAALCFDR